MRLVTYAVPGGAMLPGVVVDERVYSLARLGFASLLDVIAAGDAARDRVRFLLATTLESASAALADVTLHAPIPRPPKLICVGLNYRDHAAEGKMEIPGGADDLQQIHQHRDGAGMADRAAEELGEARL